VVFIGIRSLEEAAEYERDKKKREEDIKAENHRSTNEYLSETGRTQPSLRRSRGIIEDDDNAIEVGSSKKMKRDANSLDLRGAPGFNLLQDKEVTLCEAVYMLPMHYLACKEAIVR
jgi:hypothetical protein